VTADKLIYCWIDRVIICSCIYLYILFNLNNNDKLHVLYFGSLFSFTCNATVDKQSFPEVNVLVFIHSNPNVCTMYNVYIHEVITAIPA
jgi:hypothetical protein